MPMIPKRDHYVMIGGCTNLAAPADSSSYHFGGYYSGGADLSALNYQRLYIPKTGTIVAAILNTWAITVTGTNENISAYLRINDTTDTLIQTIGAATQQRFFSNYALNIAVTRGDFVHFKVVTPTWVTNPQNFVMTGVFIVKVK